MTVRFFYPSAKKALASCTTIRICLCKSFKELNSKWSASEPYPYQRHGKASFATAKVHLSGKLTKYSHNFLANFAHLTKLYIIYNI